MNSRIRHYDPDFPAYVSVLDWHGYYAAIMEWDKPHDRYSPGWWRGPKRSTEEEAAEDAAKVAAEEGLEVR